MLMLLAAYSDSSGLDAGKARDDSTVAGPPACCMPEQVQTRIKCLLLST